MAEDPLIVPMHMPLRGKLFLPFLASAPLALGAWIVFAPSWESVIYGGVGILAFIFVAGIVLANQRASRGRLNQIVATSEGISSPTWSIPWSRVAQMWIGRNQGVRVLYLDPFDTDDIEHPRSIFYSLGFTITRMMRMPALSIPEMNIDRPLETLLAQLHEKAASHAETTVDSSI